MRRYKAAFPAAGLVLLLFAALLGGCSRVEEIVSDMEEEVWVPDATTVQIGDDGSVTETILDELDRDYYSGTELEEMVTKELAAYNARFGNERISLTQSTIEEGKVTLVLTYAAASDYMSFNELPMFQGSMLGAQMEGYLFDNDFYKVTDGVQSEKSVSNEEPLSHKEYQVLVSDLYHVARVPGKIMYVSANAAVGDEFTAIPVQEQTAKEESGLVLPSSAVYITREEEVKDTEEDMEKTYMYVIYEF